MARPKSPKPAYCLHKSSRRAFVKLNGHRVYLGRHGSQGSRDEYDRIIGEWIASGRQSVPGITPEKDAPRSCVVTEVAASFWVHAQTYYAVPGGERTGEVEHFRNLLKLLKRLYGNTPAVEFGPLALKALMAEMVKLKWSRGYVNAQANRVKRVFKWAVGAELIPPHIPEALAAVPGYRKGKCEARECPKVRPVPQEHVDTVLPHVSKQVKAIIELQLVTGMRPGEAVIMRGCDIDTTGTVWTYKPSRHKKEHLDEERIIDLGPRAQEIIRPFLKTDLQAFLFSPAEAEVERLEARRNARKTPMTPSQQRRADRAASTPRRRGAKDRYTVATYRRAIERGCEIAFGMPKDLKATLAPSDLSPEQQAEHARLEKEKTDKRSAWHQANVWHPHQLRHNAATWLRKEFGLDVARIILGHTSDTMTAVYAEKDRLKAREIMGKVG